MPLVVSTTAGRPVAEPDAERGEAGGALVVEDVDPIAARSASASASGVDREPGSDHRMS